MHILSIAKPSPSYLDSFFGGEILPASLSNEPSLVWKLSYATAPYFSEYFLGLEKIMEV